MSTKPQRAILDIEELDTNLLSQQLTIDGVVSSVDAAVRHMNLTAVRLSPTDRAGLFDRVRGVRAAAEAFAQAASDLQRAAGIIEASALVAYHRAELPGPSRARRAAPQPKRQRARRRAG